MNQREYADQLAWESIRNRVPLRLDGGIHGRSRDYRELELQLRSGTAFEHAWSDFLHAFYDYRVASFFAYPSPECLSGQMQALLAGAAEWLSREFSLPHPLWTNRSCYFLPIPWDPVEDLGLDMSAFIEEKLARSPEAFRKRNIAFASRNLIAL